MADALGAPFVSAETVSTALWLNGMHLAAAVPIVGLPASTLPNTKAEGRS